LDPGLAASNAFTTTGTVNDGLVYSGHGVSNPVGDQAITDLTFAYNFANALTAETALIVTTADLGTQDFTTIGGGVGIIPPGVYSSGSSLEIDSPVTLDAGFNPNAVWVFQMPASTLTTTTPIGNIILLHGAQAKNVYWVPTLDATIGVGTVFYGTLVSGRDVTAVTGATINGRILAGATTAGTIALQDATVNVPAP